MNPGSCYISCAVYHQLVFKNVSKLKCFIDSSLQRMDCIAVYESKTAKVLQSTKVRLQRSCSLVTVTHPRHCLPAAQVCLMGPYT